MAILNGFYAFPARVVSLGNWKQKFELHLLECKDDLPEPRYISTELKMWEVYCRKLEGVPPATLSALLSFIDKLTFPNIYASLQILAMLPVTTCTCERMISVLRRLKTYLRSTLSEQRLNGLALPHVHRDIDIDIRKLLIALPLVILGE